MFKMIKAGKVPKKDLNQSLSNLKQKSLNTMILFQVRFRFNSVLLPKKMYHIDMAKEGPDLNLLVKNHNPQS